MPVDAPAAPAGLQSRRAFCVRTCQAVSLAGTGALLQACGGGGGGGGNPAGPTPPAPTLPVISGSFANGTISVSVGSTSPLAAVGGAALVQSSGGNVLVARTAENAFTAVSGTCTHEACAITGRQNETFVCPCHGSRFANNGAVVNGPATRPLPQFATRFADGVLTITL